MALGHHRDDIVETLFLNMFYQGKLKAMPPKLLSDDKKNMLIRPLAYCRETDLIALADLKQFPIIPCNLCGSQEGLQRNAVKEMLIGWERQFPGRIDTIFGAIKNVAPSQLADTDLFNFTGLKLDREGASEDVLDGLSKDPSDGAPEAAAEPVSKFTDLDVESHIRAINIS